MRPPEGAGRHLISEWVHKAEADMSTADHLLTEGPIYSGIIAFHSQQAAEKYLKALLTQHHIAFPKTHDLERLLRLVRKVDGALADALSEVIILSLYGVEVRYPGDRPDVTLDEARQAVALARLVSDAVTDRLRDLG